MSRNKPRKYPSGKLKRTFVGVSPQMPMARIVKPLAENIVKMNRLRLPRTDDKPGRYTKQEVKLAKEYMALYNNPSRGRNKARGKTMKARGGTFKGTF